jgi:glutamine amidotransferase
VIAIIDYGMGNLGSIANMLRKIGAEAVVSSDPAVIEAADRLVLPGVGAFAHGMASLEQRGLVPVLQRRVLEDEVPILGICLGMQLFTQGSEEGGPAGLGWIAGRTSRFRLEGQRYRVPHMGWNTVIPRREHPLLADLPEDPRFYFVHSYHVTCDDPADQLCGTVYGYEFTSAVARGNIIGTQFHPEKSHRFGFRLLQNFATGTP